MAEPHPQPRTESPAPRPRAIVRLAASFAATTGLAIASVVWSESWFWSRWRPEDSLPGTLLALVVYGLAVQVCLFAAQRFRVAAEGAGAWRRVFLIGAAYGWLVEGVLVTTVLDALPWTIPYTGLAWHALFTVLVGWWLIPRLLARSVAPSLAWLAAIGFGVGTWAIFWRFNDGAPVEVPAFALFVSVSSVAYALGLYLWMRFRGIGTPALLGTLPAIIVLAGYVVLNAVSSPLTLLGPALVALTGLLLWFTRPADAAGPGSAAVLGAGGPAPVASLWRLAVIPVAATLAYAALGAWPDPIPTGWLFFAVTVPAGVVLYIVAAWRRASTTRQLAQSTDG